MFSLGARVPRATGALPGFTPAWELVTGSDGDEGASLGGRVLPTQALVSAS